MVRRAEHALVYIDPPFDVGADFTMGVPFGSFQVS